MDGPHERLLEEQIAYYQREDLAARLSALGWQMTVRATANYFLYAFGSTR